MKKIYYSDWKNIFRLLALTMVQLSLILLSNGCKTAEPEMDLKLADKHDVSNKEGFGLVPFYERGKLSFSAAEALKRMELRKEKERKFLEEEKGEFKVMADERFRGLAFSYWITPPENPDIIAALRKFPKDAFGYPDWVAAANRGIIRPADSITGESQEEEEEFDDDIIFEINDRMMANVRFPHRVHNYWLSCKVCHPGIFIAKKGANDIAMTKIWAGKFCGRCHGAVAYPPKGFENCIRCHSVGRKKVFMNY